jgi:hypothetical protein
MMLTVLREEGGNRREALRPGSPEGMDFLQG